MLVQWTQKKTGCDVPRKYGTMEIQRLCFFPSLLAHLLLVYSVIFLWLSQKRLMQIACHNYNCFFFSKGDILHVSYFLIWSYDCYLTWNYTKKLVCQSTKEALNSAANACNTGGKRSVSPLESCIICSAVTSWNRTRLSMYTADFPECWVEKWCWLK